MNFEELFKEFRAGRFRPVYFLMGEEPFFIDRLVDWVEHNALDEGSRSFNQSVLYGRETDTDTILAEAKRYPMMGDLQVVLVKEAQHLRKLENLLSYIENPQPTTLLVIAYKYKTLDKRTKFYKALCNAAVVFESKRIYDNQLPVWIERLVRDRGMDITPKATALLAEHLGTDLGRVFKEIEKLEILLDRGARIDENTVETHVGISKEYNNFELIRALAHGDHYKAQMIARYFSANPKDNPLVLTLGLLYGFFTKLLIVHSAPSRDPQQLASRLKVAPVFVQDYLRGAQQFPLPKAVQAIGLLRETDGKSKGLGNSSLPDNELLRELLTRIMMP